MILRKTAAELIKPFAGLRPPPEHASEVIAPPYDVVSIEEALQLVVDRPWSFLHISRPEIDLPEGLDPYSPEVYAQARINLERMREAGLLQRDPTPGYYVYRLSVNGHIQTGLVALASVAAYDAGRIKKHELTRPAKEDDRVRQIEAVAAQTGPVLLTYRGAPEIDALLEQVSIGAPEVDVTAVDGVRHQLWPISDPALIESLSAAFDALDALYIADGHHRAAAASRVAAARAAGQNEGDWQGFLAVLFAHQQMRILDYNRLIRDLNGQDRDEFLRRIAERFEVIPSPNPAAPQRPGEFGLYLQGDWFRLIIDPARIPQADPVGRLDAQLLQTNLIGPVLGIDDPRRDSRIDFVGGSRGLSELAQRVDSGEMALALALYPVAIEELMAVADADALMPPKSTWFEPKLADGLVSHLI